MNISPQSPMSAVLENFPGAQRAFFATSSRLQDFVPKIRMPT
jgi:hypothetical protein